MMVFKLMTLEDLPICLQFLYNAALRLKQKGLTQWSYWLEPPEEKLAWIKNGIAEQQFYKVLDTNGAMVAMFRLQTEDELYWGKQDEKANYIHSLVVSDEATNKGIGRAIIHSIESQMRTDGINLLRLDCDSANPDLCAYYENLGFKKVGTKQMSLSLNNLYEKIL
jgi:GNAT superfamily N-acetyltransferase